MEKMRMRVMLMEQLEEIQGIVDNVVFASDDGRFTVFRLKVDDAKAVPVTVNGPAPLLGQQLELVGEWIEHPKFGAQFKARQIKRLAPTSEQGIERFLASGAVKGVGPAMAKRLVAKFGMDTLVVIAKQPGRLREISGIGAKTADKIHESYTERAELGELMLFLETHGVSGAFAGKIFAKYGSFAVETIEKDPYTLAREVGGIGFRTADQLAASLGMDKASFDRVAAGIDFALLQISGAGHCCVPEEMLVNETARLIAVSGAAVRDVMRQLMDNGLLCVEYFHGINLLYPPALYHAECNVAAKLLYLRDNVRPLKVADAAEKVRQWSDAENIVLAADQFKALESVLEHGVMVLTGGPGTGKTTVVKGMLALLEQQGLKILLGAPTGRAAKRLSETTGRQATTVHRLLESAGRDGDEPVFGRDETQPLEADAIILDEVSMMDISLMSYFLEAVEKGCRVILVGDVDQLPAVGPGSVLKDILRSTVIPSVRLTEVFRQAGKSLIVMNAHAINQGRLPECQDGSEFEFHVIDDSAAVANEIVRLCAVKLPKDGYDILRDIQVLSPMHRQDCGVENLNRLLQAALNPPSAKLPSIQSAGQVLRQGDKVMQIRNNYQKNVFNGDIGFICGIDESSVTVRYTDADVAYDKGELLELKLAYAMSVHKSQGSEYKIIVMPLVPAHHIMLQRNLLYTAVTRAKERVILLGGKNALYTAVTNERTKKRYSLLTERLSAALH